MTRSSDRITPEERLLIDATIAEGRVQRIASGVRAVPISPEVIYDAKINRVVLLDKSLAARRLRYCSVFKPKRKK